jgi:aldehyde:ferredoxin oxidoreductase
MSHGCHGKILWVDLTERSFDVRELPESVYRDYLGGHGLGAKVLWDNQPAGADPLGPDNVLGFVPGLLTDTGALYSGRYMVVGKSPLTGMWGDANSGGYFSPALKRTGYDGVFLRGKASQLVYVLVGEDGCEIKDAAHLAGLSPEDTESAIRRELQDNKIKVAAIGPAGEKLSLISCIINDAGRAAARSGLGAVMGAKGVKAIAVRGDRRVSVHDEKRLKELNDSYLRRLKAGASFMDKMAAGDTHRFAKMLRKLPVAMRTEGGTYGELLRKYGTSGAMAYSVEVGDAPVKNYDGVGFIDFDMDSKSWRLSDESVIKYQKKRFFCHSCPLGCGGIVSVPDGKYKIDNEHKPEYETLAAFGSLCLNDDLESIIMLNHICNTAGFDTISAGVTVAFAIECFEQGILGPADTDGLELRWGDADVIIELVNKMAAREGVGDLLADGVKAASQKIGRGSEKFAMHVAGQEVPMHDPRFDPSFATAYTAEPAPGKHTTSSRTYFEMMRFDKKFPELGKAGQLTLKKSKYKYSGKGAAQAAVSEYFQAASSAGLCMFSMITGGLPLDELLRAVAGWDVTPRDCLTIGHRILTLRQCYNVREGVSPGSIKLPDRMLGKPPQDKGPLAGVTIDLETLKGDFYGALGWDPNSGAPSRECLESLGIEAGQGG